MKYKPMTDTFKEQLGAIITEYESALSRSAHTDASDVFTLTQITDLQTRCTTAIERATGSSSTYYRKVMEISKEIDHIYGHVAGQIGVAKALLYDIHNNYMKSFEELIHGDIFGDFLEMADHLLENGYKDPAAVLAGSTLEVHMKKLCDNYSVEITSNEKPKSSYLLNADLQKKGAYTKLDQKNITAWLGLRNNAAHGNYSEYTKEQVSLFAASIRDFITRNPA